MAKKFSIHIKKSKEGSLHKALGVPEGQKIPASKLKIKSTDSPALKKKKNFAINAKKFKHQTGGNDFQIPNPDFNTYQATHMEQDPNNPGFDMQGNPLTQSSQDFPGIVSGTNMNIDITGNLAQQQSQNQQQDPNRIKFLDSAAGKNLNTGISAITGLFNVIDNSKLKHQEKLQMLDSMTPKYMTNQESQGLDNGPAYKKMGGPINHGSPVGIVDFNSGNGLEDGMYDGINHQSFYGQDQIYNGEMGEYKTGGSVSQAKAKEILRDGTAQGHPLTDKQKKYFGWIAGGKKQAGGTSSQQTTDPNAYWEANAKLSYYKQQLNDKLRAKNPEAYDNYLKGLNDIQSQYQQGKIKPQDFIPKRQEYAQNASYNDYLAPQDVQNTLGDEYNNYLQSLQTVNKYNVQKGQQPLYGNVEGENDPSQLNYGRRFATMTTNTSNDSTTLKNGKPITTNSTRYTYNPKTKTVDTTSSVVQYDENGNPITNQTATRQTGGYSVGQEVELTPAQIKSLKAQGYQIKEL